MFRRILVPLDGSAFAESALYAAYSLAAQNKGQIRLVYALEPIPGQDNYLPFESPDRAWAEEYLADTSRTAPAGVTVSTSLRDGFAEGSITAEAQDWGADIIVMTTHGRGGLARAWMGSVADNCIRSATCPVLAVRAPETGALKQLARKRVVVPLDGSKHAEEALPYGVALASHFGVPLTLLLAVVPHRSASASSVTDVIDRGREASEYLRDTALPLRNEGVDVVENVVTDTGAAHAILECAASDLVVMSTRGHTGLQRAVFGSVADKVVRGSTGAVLVIPPVGVPSPVPLEAAHAAG